MTLIILQWIDALLGVTGSLLVTGRRSDVRFLGFCFFLASNTAWLAFSVGIGAWGLMAMNVAFSVTSCIGLINNGSKA